MTCAIEIVIHAYMTTTHKFPWVLECFSLDAYNFYKIIEPIALNHKDLLSRDLIKHLNSVSKHFCYSSPLFSIMHIIITNKNSYSPDRRTVHWFVGVAYRFTAVGYHKSMFGQFTGLSTCWHAKTVINGSDCRKSNGLWAQIVAIANYGRNRTFSTTFSGRNGFKATVQTRQRRQSNVVDIVQPTGIAQ